MRVLGIETSCDETAAAIVDDGRVLSDMVASQIEDHRPYGGVVPEIASRRHMANIATVIEAAFRAAGVAIRDIDGVAVTTGPGLVGALLVGLQAAKGIAAARSLPFVGVNHLRGHLLAARIESGGDPRPDFPYMAALASGGHTGLYLVEGEDRISCLGMTRDDAAGEAYDKVAKLLGLGYPGGPVIDRLAAGDGPVVRFTQALRSRRSRDFSFSGIKTAVAQRVAASGGKPGDEEKAAIARGFQQAVVGIIVRKLVIAARDRGVRRIVLAGGVAANSELRRRAAEAAAEKDLELFVPRPALCTDNGAMIAYVGWLDLVAGRRDAFDLAPRASWSP